MRFNFVELPNTGILQAQFSNEQLEPIRKEIENIRSNFFSAEKFNSKLAGQIKKEFSLESQRDYLEKLLMPFVIEYEQRYSHLSKGIAVMTREHKPVLDTPWVNFQEKYEYNPPHHHHGTLSFVIWLQVPFFKAEESKCSPGAESSFPNSGNFSFHYTNILGNIVHESIPVDKTFENTMLMFPAGLNHSVNPFYSSDDYRISVAGNFRFDSDS